MIWSTRFSGSWTTGTNGWLLDQRLCHVLCAKFKERMNEIELIYRRFSRRLLRNDIPKRQAKDSKIRSMYSTLGRDSRLPKDLQLRVQFGRNSLRQASRLLMRKRSKRIIMYPNASSLGIPLVAKAIRTSKLMDRTRSGKTVGFTAG